MLSVSRKNRAEIWLGHADLSATPFEFLGCKKPKCGFRVNDAARWEKLQRAARISSEFPPPGPHSIPGDRGPRSTSSRGGGQRARGGGYSTKAPFFVARSARKVTMPWRQAVSCTPRVYTRSHLSLLVTVAYVPTDVHGALAALNNGAALLLRLS